MTVLVRASQVALPTSGSTFDVTIAGIGTPKAALFFATRNTTADVAVDHAALSYGFTDGTGEYCIAYYSEDAVFNSNCETGLWSKDSVHLKNSDGSADDAVFSFDSWITDGVRLTVDVAPPSGYLLSVVFFSGDEIEAYCGSVVTSSTIGNSVDVTAPGFLPDAVFMFSGNLTDNSTTKDVQFFVGFADAAERNRAGSHAENHGENTTKLGGWGSDTRATKVILSQVAGVVERPGIRLHDFDASGFSAETQDDARAASCRYLALSFGSKSAEVGSGRVPPSAGVKAFPMAGPFKPQAAIGFASPFITLNEVKGNFEAAGLCFFFASEHYGSLNHSATSRDAAGTTQTQSMASLSAIKSFTHNSVLEYEVEDTGVVLNTGQMELAFDPGSAGEPYLFWMLIEEDSGTVLDSAPLVLGATDPLVSIIFNDPGAGLVVNPKDTQPSVDLGINVAVAAAPLELGSLEPSVDLGINVAVAAAPLELGSLEPSVDLGINVAVAAAPLELGAYAPAIQFGINQLDSGGPLVLGAPLPAVSKGILILDSSGGLLLGLLEPVLSVGLDPVNVLLAPASLVVRNLKVMVINGTQYFSNRERIQNKLIELALDGMFLPAVFDSNSGMLHVSSIDYDRIAPVSVGADETHALATIPRRNRQDGRRERTFWAFELRLDFKGTVSVEVFERDLAANVPVLPRDLTKGLQQVRLLWTDTRYEHPPQKNSSSGTRALMSFEAVLSPV